MIKLGVRHEDSHRVPLLPFGYGRYTLKIKMKKLELNASNQNSKVNIIKRERCWILTQI